MFAGRNVVLGITAGIAAYKTCALVSRLRHEHCNVDVIMTPNATNFVTPLTMQTLSQNKVIVDTFAVLDRDEQWQVEHVSLAKKADIFVIAPASADVIAKLANGIADDMLTTTVLATRAPILLCPAMNTAMYDNEITQVNLQTLRSRGYTILEPDSGILACGDVGRGRMVEPEEIYERIRSMILPKQDLKGKRILVSSGGTSEPIDPVRRIVNNSSGKMGIAIAAAAKARGAEVTLVLGRHTATVPPTITDIVGVETTLDMYDAVVGRASECDCIIMAAAPADYRMAKPFDTKYKGETLTLELVKNPDIAATIGHSDYQGTLIVFAAESTDLDRYAAQKLVDKNADMLVANDVSLEGAGFGADTNIVSIYTRDGQVTHYPKMQKTEVADLILDRYLAL